MTDEEKVKRVYPDAKLVSCWPPFWFTVATRIGGTVGYSGVRRRIIGAANGEAEAWADAASRLTSGHEGEKRHGSKSSNR